MRTYNFKDSPLKVHGLMFDDKGEITRIPQSVADLVNENTAKRNRNAVGGRIRFKTNSKVLELSVKLASNRIDWAIPLSGSAGADVFVGKGELARKIGNIAPHNYTDLEATGRLNLSGEMQDITINLPRNEPVLDVNISVEDDALVLPPDDYTYTTPIVFYGSSITEGGCASSPCNAYTSLVSRWLDSDYINLGYSNAAHGEQVMADYIKGLDMSVLVMDYDHNARSADELSDTHEAFYKTIREARPELPIIMISMAGIDSNFAVNSARRSVIRKTYENAVAAGDNKVWFIDGERLFGNDNRSVCLVECVHPNDLGFMRMAKAIYPFIKKALA